MIDTLRWGAQHVGPITLTLPPMGVLQMAPSVGYRETWFQVKSIRSYNAAKDTMFVKTQKGIYTARQMSFSLGVSTRIFGMLTSTKKDSRFVALRHELRPSISFSYQPICKNNYYFLRMQQKENTIFTFRKSFKLLDRFRRQFEIKYSSENNDHEVEIRRTQGSTPKNIGIGCTEYIGIIISADFEVHPICESSTFIQSGNLPL